jgi:hypothetical protein
MSGHHYLPTNKIFMISDNVEFLPPIFYAVFWQPFRKWQTSRKYWKRRIAPLMVTYHYVKFYVSIIIHLEVININVWNFNFPIGFYSNPHPLWTSQNMTLTPFTTKLKTLGPTRKRSGLVFSCGNWQALPLRIFKSPKQRLETYCFCSVSFFLSFFPSVDHELVHGRSQELLGRISWNLVEL